MDVSKEQPHTTAGLDLGDKYSYLCLIDTQSGEIMEEGRLRTTPEALLPALGPILEHIGSLTEQLLRKLLVSSAHYILGPFGRDSDLRRHAEKIASRGGTNSKKRAVVAVARKLSVLLHSLWVTGEVYEPLPNARASGGKAA